MEKKSKSRLASALKLPSTLTSMMFFHAICDAESIRSKKTLKVPAFYKNGIIVAVAGQLVMDAWLKCFWCVCAAKNTEDEL